jgi:DNA processing protein
VIGVSAGGPVAGDAAARAARDEREAMAVLVSVQNLGPMTLARVLERYRSAREVLDAAAGRHGVRELVAASAGADGAARPMPVAVAEAVRAAAGRRREIVDRIGALGLRIVLSSDPDYPSRLGRIDMPPAVLFAKGNSEILGAAHVVAVVGTRHPSDAGRRTAARISAALARAGAVVVSGLAIGIDGASHAAVLEAGGLTAAYIGGGHERLFPATHDRLATAIVERGGAILSEYAPDTEPTKGTFPRRNRLISGSADAVVVVEAGARSGAILTANWALEQGRDCYIVPGSLDAPTSAGCLGFLRDWHGLARIVAGVPQLLDDLGLAAEAAFPPLPATTSGEPGPALPGPGGRRRRIGSAVGGPSRTAALLAVGTPDRQVGEAVCRGAATVDEIVALTRLTVPVVLGSLTRLEGGGLVEARRGRYLPSGALAA